MYLFLSRRALNLEYASFFLKVDSILVICQVLFLYQVPLMIYRR